METVFSSSINWNKNIFAISSSIRFAVPRQRRSRFFELPTVGVHRFCDHIRVQSLPLHSNEAVLSNSNPLSWNDWLRYNRVDWESR